MKHLALLMVIVGMAMAAAFGSQNADPIRLSQIIKGRAAVLGQETGKAKTSYCQALPGGERSKEQLADGCAAVPQTADASAVDEVGSSWSKQRKVAAAAKQLAALQKRTYCGMAAGDKLSEEQAKDGCSPVKKNGSADEVVKSQEAWLAARTALAPLEAASQAKRAEYCAMIVDGKPTDKQIKDGCVPGSQAADAARIDATRAEWQTSWQAVPVARKALADAYATLCNIKVDGHLVAEQRSASCQPAKEVADGAKISEARSKWQATAKDAADNGKVAGESKAKLCSLAAGELTPTQKKAGCPPIPAKADAAKVGELRKKWQELKELSGYATAAKQHAAGAVDAGTRMSGWFNVAGIPFLLGLLLMAIGGILARKQAKAEALAQGKSDGDSKSASAPTDFGELLQTTADAIRALHTEAASKDGAPSQADLDATKSGIEAIQQDNIERIVTARAALIARYGMGGFAEIFGPFSASERYMNRAWSALVDMYWHETVDSLKVAVEHMDEAGQALQKVMAETKAA